jgi:serine/threonine-protein kinase RsbW
VRIEVVICLPREAETVALVRSALGETLRTFGVEADCVEDIRLAVSEACTNVIKHAGTDEEYEVQVDLDETTCAIYVRNTGHAFDAAAVDNQPPDPLSARGRGVAIMRAVMDNVDFHSEPPTSTKTGAIVHLVRRLQVRPDSPIGRLSRSNPPGSE